jgi:hypothetical protein
MLTMVTVAFIVLLLVIGILVSGFHSSK